MKPPLLAFCPQPESHPPLPPPPPPPPPAQSPSRLHFLLSVRLKISFSLVGSSRYFNKNLFCPECSLYSSNNSGWSQKQSEEVSALSSDKQQPSGAALHHVTQRFLILGPHRIFSLTTPSTSYTELDFEIINNHLRPANKQQAYRTFVQTQQVG